LAGRLHFTPARSSRSLLRQIKTTAFPPAQTSADVTVRAVSFANWHPRVRQNVHAQNSNLSANWMTRGLTLVFTICPKLRRGFRVVKLWVILNRIFGGSRTTTTGPFPLAHRNNPVGNFGVLATLPLLFADRRSHAAEYFDLAIRNPQSPISTTAGQHRLLF